MKSSIISNTLKVLTIGVALLCNSVFAYTTHKVQKGESLWGLAHKYKVSVDDLIAWNPKAEKGLKTGMTLKIPEAGEKPGKKTAEKPKQTPSTQKTTETKPQQPQKDIKLYEGQSESTKVEVVKDVPDFVKSSLTKKDQNTTAENQLPQVEPEQPAEENVNTPAAEVPAARQRLTVLVALPFNAKASPITRQNLMAMEFYKGLLLGMIDAAANGYDTPVKVITLDTSLKTDSIKAAIAAVDKKSLSLIIPSEEETVLPLLEKYGMDNKIPVLNLFSIKDQGHVTNPYVLQCNISQKQMYAKAIKSLMTNFTGYTPVILSPTGEKTEKAGFIEALKAEYKKKNIQPITITYTGNLTDKHLAKLKANGKYVFIPMSGSASAFNTFADKLSDLIGKNSETKRIKLFGYPDWVLLRGEDKDKLHLMNATIYSRFFIDNDNSDVKAFSDEFKLWYGNDMVEAIPVQAVLGYDTGNLVMKMLSRNSEIPLIDKAVQSRHEGLQSAFVFAKEGKSKGVANESLYIIEYLPGGTFYIKTI